MVTRLAGTRIWGSGHRSLGDRSLALDWLERSYQNRDYWLLFINVDPLASSVGNHKVWSDDFNVYRLRFAMKVCGSSWGAEPS